MIFREAQVADIPQIQVVRNAVKENTLSDPRLVPDEDCEDYITRRGKGWVCEINNTIVGFAIVDLVDHNVWALFIQPGFDKQGIGRRLHDDMINWYFDQTNTTIWLGTAPNTRAESFYRKAGWKEIGTHGKGEIKFEMTAEDWKKKRKIKLVAIRKEKEADRKRLHEIITSAFGREDEAMLVDRLRNSDAFIPQLSLVAETAAGITGHILFTKITIEDEHGGRHGSLALAPMAVDPHWQRRGIGSLLVQQGLVIATGMGYRSVIVQGDPGYYPRFGFKRADAWNIRPPYPVDAAAYMAIELQEGGLEGVSGIVRYSEEFKV